MKKQTLMIAIGASLLFGCSKQQYSLPDESQEFASTVRYNNKVDVLLMVDNSSSMDTYQNKLANQIPAMLNALNQLEMDYRIVVVTSDTQAGGSGGKFVGSPKVLTKTTPNLPTVLTSRVRQGTGGSDLECGMQSIEKALTVETGFLRSDAMLAVLILSNEDDHSIPNAAYYEEYFNKLRPKMKGFNAEIQGWVLNFIGVPNLESNCSTALDGIYKEAGLKYIELAQASGGLVQPICDSTLAQAVANIQKRIVEVLTDFHLNRKPKLGTIVVTINGQTIPESKTNGWEYIENGDLIRFHGSATPTAASSVVIDFTPAEAM